MTFSVVIPAYNRKDFIRRAILSVADQDCVDRSGIEIIVIDDGSGDGTADVAEATDTDPATLRVMMLPHSGQPGTARNAGLRASEGEFVAYCDSDDYWLPHHLATAAQRFKRDPGLGMVANYWGLASFEAAPDGEIREKIVVPPHPTWAVNTNCRVHRRSCVDKVGTFNTSRWGEDGDFFERIERNFKHAKTGVVTSVNGYIRGGNNLTYESDENVRNMYM